MERSQYVWQLSTAQGVTTEPFPGRSCPGLIEARHLEGLGVPGTLVIRSCPGLIERPGTPANFRGEAAPASLKRDSVPGRLASSGPPNFRGEAAPASLKRAQAIGVGLGPSDNATGFPGRSCPGLIEARRTAAPVRPRLAATAASKAGGGPLGPHFRGEAAPASLKPGAQAACHLTTPGRSCPGLIEANSEAALEDQCVGDRFPGRSCPGLIEARRICRSSRSYFHLRLIAGLVTAIVASFNFRGEAAPASLKPWPHTAWFGSDRKISGRSCPGLIEAPVYRHFRGEAAPASLKQLPRPGRVRPLSRRARSWGARYFRGEAAPASLKRRQARFPGRSCPSASLKPPDGLAQGAETAQGVRVFPGRSCPGLIEASSNTERTRRFPGRSCPGLIGEWPTPTWPDFRGEAAPASLKHRASTRNNGPCLHPRLFQRPD